jgi:hypothetical protein
MSKATELLEAFAFKSGTTTHHAATECPVCKAELDASDGLPGERPSPGDYSICCYCAAILRFGEGLELTAMSPSDMAALPVADREELEGHAGLMRSAKLSGMRRRGEA